MSKLNQSMKCKDQEIQTCSSNERQFKTLVKPVLPLDPCSESSLNLNWKSKFRCFLECSVSVDKKGFEDKEKRIIKVSYNKVYNECCRNY